MTWSSSAGVKLSRFVGVTPGADRDTVLAVADPVFNLAGLNTRRAEPRNTPTVINAAFNRRQFWDVRASNLFNGVSPFGAGDEKARVLMAADQWQRSRQVKVRIDNAGLASQAVGPPLSDREMGSLDRKFRDIGKRLGIGTATEASNWWRATTASLGRMLARRLIGTSTSSATAASTRLIAH